MAHGRGCKRWWRWNSGHGGGAGSGSEGGVDTKNLKEDVEAVEVAHTLFKIDEESETDVRTCTLSIYSPFITLFLHLRQVRGLLCFYTSVVL